MLLAITYEGLHQARGLGGEVTRQEALKETHRVFMELLLCERVAEML